MRKKTVNHIADAVFWYIIYFLPVMLYLLYMFTEPSQGGSAVPFLQYFDNVGFGFVSNNLLIDTMRSIFGINGVLPLFSTDLPFFIMGWFMSMVVLHLAVDFVLFIPRLAHKWLNYFTKGD